MNILGQYKRGLLTFGCIALMPLVAAGATGEDKRSWKPLAADGVHDPASPALTQLQAPDAALSKLPAGSGGDLVDWGEALRQGLIAPRAGIDPKSASEALILDGDILLNPNGSQQPVRFPHKDHTQWLDCTNCHEALFKMEKGAGRISMLRILEGQQCGVCHGAIAFPLTECKRCHNTPWSVKPARRRQ